MRASLRAFAVIVAVVAPVSAQPSPDANRLMQEIIDSLAVTADAHGAIVNAGAGDIEHMTGTRLAIGKLNQAAQLMEPFAKSPDGMSSDVASAFSLVYQSLAELLTQSLDTFEKVVRIEGRVRDGGTASYAV